MCLKVKSKGLAFVVFAMLQATQAWIAPQALAQGASDLGPPLELSYDALAACVRRDNLQARALALDAIAKLCEEQNLRQAAEGLPRCPARECVDTVVLRYGRGRMGVPVKFELTFESEARRVALGFRMDLGFSLAERHGWPVVSLRCRAPFDFLAWNGRLGEAERFFEEMLAAAPRCTR